MRISDWSSDVCSSDLLPLAQRKIKSSAVIGPLANAERDTLGPWVFPQNRPQAISVLAGLRAKVGKSVRVDYSEGVRMPARVYPSPFAMLDPPRKRAPLDETAEIRRAADLRSEEHTSELPSLMRNSYAVFCLKKKNIY